jgi:hypothetical protein
MTDEPLEDVGAPEPAPPPPPEPEGWKRDKAGKEYISIPGRRGVIRRRGEETISEALERDQRPKDDKPAGKKKRTIKQPDAPKDVDLKGLEQALAEAFRSPAMIAGLAGDVYLANHFTVWGPRLARNLVVSAEHNPWLRRHLETMAGGGSAAVGMISLIGLAGGVLAYAAPPLIYVFNLPAPAMAREMFDIPERRNGRPETAPGSPLSAVA